MTPSSVESPAKDAALVVLSPSGIIFLMYFCCRITFNVIIGTTGFRSAILLFSICLASFFSLLFQFF